MSSLRVLTIGNNPNVLLYTWRFQLAKSVQVYHVSEAVTSGAPITVESEAYGKDTFTLGKHFKSVDELLKQEGTTVIDLVILSSSSLQEISSLAAKLNPVLNLNTKIFVESSGFVHLEPFVKMSIDFAQLKVFSILTDYDFRQVGENHYRQFNSTPATIYIGESGVKFTNQGIKYPKDIVSLLTTFQALFSKLFPKDQIDLCNLSYTDFLSQQWKLALPSICFDPLLVLLEESNPSNFNQQILAKPLISGLVTEIITVTKTMGGRLATGFDNESDLLSQWLKTNRETPKMVYHFIHRTAPLDVDMLLLQPILLADDYGIKTPYLEFLYSMMCQFQKLNNGESKWFTRTEKVHEWKTQLTNLINERDSLHKQLDLKNASFQEKEQQFANQLKSKEDTEEQYKQQVLDMQGQIRKLREELVSQQKRLDQAHYQAQQLQTQSQVPNHPNHQIIEKPQIQQQQYSDTGTPNMRDIEDIAVFSVSYNGESPGKNVVKPAEVQTEINKGSTSTSFPYATSSSTELLTEEQALRERELEIRKKELELQERELEFQRKATAPKNGPQPQPPVFPPTSSRKSSYQLIHSKHQPQQTQHQPQQTQHQPPPPPLSSQQLQYQQRRNMHGAAQQSQQNLPASSATNFVDPVSASQFHQNSQQPYGNGGFVQPMPPAPHHPHQFKTTSRKNRRSNMPNLRNASNTALEDFASMNRVGSSANGMPSPSFNGTTSRFNSLSAGVQPPRILNQRHNGSNPQMTVPRINMPNPTKPTSYTAPNGLSPSFNQQRLISSSTMVSNDEEPQTQQQQLPNVSMNSVVHNPTAQAHSQQQEEHQYSQPETPVLQPTIQSPQLPNINVSESTPSPVKNQFTEESPVSQTVVKNEQDGVINQQTSTEEKKKSKFGLFGKKKKKGKK